MDPADAAEREQRVDEVIAEYLQALEAGPAPDRQAILDRHPDLAPELADYFDDDDQINRWLPQGTEAEGPVPQCSPAPVLTAGANEDEVSGGDTTVDEPGARPALEPAAGPAGP